MPPDFEDFKTRLEAVQVRIAVACARAGRVPTEVTLLAVTKSQPAQAVEFAARAGLRGVGENRVQEAAEKRSAVAAPLTWELIGHLQSNKARLAVRTFERIQSVDSPRLAAVLDREAAATGKTLAVLLQVNAGQDPAKSGAEPDDAPGLLDAALACRNLRVDGLMTIAPLSDDPAVAQRTFARLREIRDKLSVASGRPLPQLSMGMSADLDAAVAEGSTIVRVGTALFGLRS